MTWTGRACLLACLLLAPGTCGKLKFESFVQSQMKVNSVCGRFCNVCCLKNDRGESGIWWLVNNGTRNCCHKMEYLMNEAVQIKSNVLSYWNPLLKYNNCNNWKPTLYQGSFWFLGIGLKRQFCFREFDVGTSASCVEKKIENFISSKNGFTSQIFSSHCFVWMNTTAVYQWLLLDFRRCTITCLWMVSWPQSSHITYREIEGYLSISGSSIHNIFLLHLAVKILGGSYLIWQWLKSMFVWIDSKQALKMYNGGASKHVYGIVTGDGSYS